jgi:hypothetical protein
VDNDGDGLVDYEDPDCCGEPLASRVLRARVLGSKEGLVGGHLRLRAILAETGHTDLDPEIEDVTIQLRNADGELLCATVGHELWVEDPPGTFRFRKPGDLAEGLNRGAIRLRRRGGVEFRTASRKMDLRRFDTPELAITVRVGSFCSTGTVRLRSRGNKGFVFP